MAIEELNNHGGGIFLRSDDANGKCWEIEQAIRGHNILIHSDSDDGIELDKEDVAELLPYLQDFVKEGTLESRRERG